MDNGKIFVSLELPKVLEKQARIQAAILGVSRSEIIRRGLTTYLNNYQKLEALLKRWNEIAPDLSDDQWSGVPIVSNNLSQLIQDTSEAIK